jgi:hypothetical protein
MSLLGHQRCGLPAWRSLGGIAEPPQPQRVAASGASELLEGTGSFNLYAQMWGSCYFNGSRNGISFISLNGRIIHVQSQSSCILALKEHRDMVESCLHMAVLLEQRQHVTMWQIPKLSSNWPYPWFLVVHRFLVQTKNYSAFDHQGIYILCVCFCHPSSSYIPIVSRLVLFWSSFGRRKTRMTWSDKRSSLWAPHISRTLGQWRPPVFLVLDVGICGDSMGFLTIQQEDFCELDTQIYDAMMLY